MPGAGTLPGPDILRSHHEGQAECEEDLQQVPDHSPARPGDGHLLRSAAQAAPGLNPVNGKRQREGTGRQALKGGFPFTVNGLPFTSAGLGATIANFSLWG